MAERTEKRRCTHAGLIAVGTALAIAGAGCGAPSGDERPQTVIECLRGTGAHVSAIPAGFGDPPTIHLAHAADTGDVEIANVYLARSRKEATKVIRMEAAERNRPYKRAGQRVAVFYDAATGSFARRVTRCVRLPALGNYEGLPG
jgi:hypothetical protein